jgi:hypothetical protein
MYLGHDRIISRIIPGARLGSVAQRNRWSCPLTTTWRSRASPSTSPLLVSNISPASGQDNGSSSLCNNGSRRIEAANHQVGVRKRVSSDCPSPLNLFFFSFSYDTSLTFVAASSQSPYCCAIMLFLLVPPDRSLSHHHHYG